MTAWTDADRVAVARLAGLHHMTTHRLRSLLRGRTPLDAVDIAAGSRPRPGPIVALLQRRTDLAARWRTELAQRSADVVEGELAELAVRVVGPADAEWPSSLFVDPDPPAALFLQGTFPAGRRRVAVIGTRNPTERGRQAAARFGHGLADADVAVVSGLALGVDGAAHRGALAAARGEPIAIVANGHDRPYPRRHTALWRQVAARGAVVSEWPPGTPPDAFRFPRRNRIIAALSEAVVVVESRETGGSLLTARDALDRDVQVMAVPGPPDCRSSLGTNRLVQDGAALVVDVDDVLTFLGLDHARSGDVPADPRPAPTDDERELLDLLRTAPRTIDRLAGDLGLELAVAAMRVARLERAGWVFEVDGWFEALDEWAVLLRRGCVDEKST